MECRKSQKTKYNPCKIRLAHSNTKIKAKASPFKRKKQRHLSDDIRRSSLATRRKHSSQQTSPNSLSYKNNDTSSSAPPNCIKSTITGIIDTIAENPYEPSKTPPRQGTPNGDIGGGTYYTFSCTINKM